MSSEGSDSSAVVRSSETSRSTRGGDWLRTGRSVRPASQRNSAACARRRPVRQAKAPSAVRQYRLRYQTTSFIDALVAGAPDGQQVGGRRLIGLDLLAHPLDQRVHAAIGDEGVAFPDPRQQRLAAEDDTGVRREQVEQIEFVRCQLYLAAAHGC